ncbi:MAG: hypothetical protein DBY42_03510 [Bacillota bacterium]|nr:MAG: hypothetical protein DBY42_03510 [Bacillota bacterium]
MEPEGEWTFEGGPKIIVGADGDPARYHRSAYDGMRQSGSLDQFGWHREGISSQASQDAWDFFIKEREVVALSADWWRLGRKRMLWNNKTTKIELISWEDL